MSKTTTEELPAVPQPVAPEAALAEDPSAPAPAPDPLTEACAEIEKWKDVALRTAAELDNYRKRVARDVQDARAYANADLLRSLIPILDNFEMGLEAARGENEQGLIYQGLGMVRRQLADFLRDMGVEEIAAQGKPFDPNQHEAMSQEPSDEVAEGAVLKVLRRGFKLKDRLLRPAMVVVASGAPKPDPTATT